MKVAIDGPAGAGKSTVARKIAEKLGILYIDTGAMYRALAWKVLKEKIDIKDKVLLRDLALRTSISLSPGSNGLLVFCDAQDITDDIRSPEVSRLVSTVAEDEGVRQIMVAQQQDLARSCDVVMDGRDITHCVLPDAEHKFFLTASIEERTRRRAQELEAKGYQVDMDSLRNEIKNRDQMDSERKVGALKVTPDSVLIDTSELSSEEVLSKVIQVIRGGA